MKFYNTIIIGNHNLTGKWAILFQNSPIKMSQVVCFFCSSVYVKESLNNLFYRNSLNFYIKFEMLHLGVGVSRVTSIHEQQGYFVEDFCNTRFQKCTLLRIVYDLCSFPFNKKKGGEYFQIKKPFSNHPSIPVVHVWTLRAMLVTLDVTHN
jgi:hypothetical protein